MGGHALSKESVRLPAAEYEVVSREVLEKLKAAFPDRKVAEVKAYAGKKDFGDMDVLISGGEGYDPAIAADAVKAVEVVRNGPVTSVGVETSYGLFQVDFIKVPPESFDFAERYFAMNDLGNLLGRIAHKAGFKLGHEGLLCVIRDKERTEHVIDEIPVTRDWGAALEFFGYDSARYEKGFNGAFRNLNDVFEFTVSSRFSNKDIYLLENRNAKSRMRDRKRKTYMEFLDWLETKPVEDMPAYPWTRESKSEFISLAKEHFPHFSEEYDRVMDKWALEQKFRERFNGELVGMWTGKSGQELGFVMRDFKQEFLGHDELVSWVMNATKEEIEMAVKKVSDGGKPDFSRPRVKP